MNVKKKRIIYLFITMFIFIPFIFTQEQDKLVEEVDVVNVVVPVRVFYQGEPVKGLKKEDFKILVNGKETAIHGFFEKTQKIAVEQPVTPNDQPRPSRMFVLIFSISGYSIDIEDQLDVLFKRVIRPNDRLMVASNNFFLRDRVVKDPEKEKARIIRILRLEIKRVRQDLRRIEFDLKSLVEDASVTGGVPVVVAQSFSARYLNIFNDYLARYANLQKTHSPEMANYLKKQDIKKWVIYFHQIGMFPQLKSQHEVAVGPLAQLYASLSSGSPWVRAELAALRAKIVTADGLMLKEMSKYFLNTEASFHTLLMKGISTIYLDYFDYRPIASDFESFIRRITKLTGGETVSSTKIEKFVDKIVEKEDVYYVLTYAPNIPVHGPTDKTKIKVTVNDNRYQLIYDNQQRTRTMKKMLKKASRKENPQICIDQLSYKNQILAISISGIKMGIIDEKKRGKILLKIKILNNQSEVLSKIEKAFLCQKEKFVLRVKPPKIGKGSDDIVVEVSDLFTGKNDIAIKEVRLAGKEEK